jgi:hypothetical protein
MCSFVHHFRQFVVDGLTAALEMLELVDPRSAFAAALFKDDVLNCAYDLHGEFRDVTMSALTIPMAETECR